MQDALGNDAGSARGRVRNQAIQEAMRALSLPDPGAPERCLVLQDTASASGAPVTVYALAASGLVVHKLTGEQTPQGSNGAPEEPWEAGCDHCAIHLTPDASFSLAVTQGVNSLPARVVWSFRLNDEDDEILLVSPPNDARHDDPRDFAEALTRAISVRAGQTSGAVLSPFESAGAV
jgi:hypothetical protein